jgi:hypothetical protein
VDTVIGKLYTIQSVIDPGSGTWQGLAGLVNIPGDGTVQNFAVDGAGDIVPLPGRAE